MRSCFKFLRNNLNLYFGTFLFLSSFSMCWGHHTQLSPQAQENMRDFISSLRNGLKTHFNILSNSKNTKEKNFDLYYYKNIKCVSFVSNINYNALSIRIDLTSNFLKHAKLNKSKKLLKSSKM